MKTYTFFLLLVFPFAVFSQDGWIVQNSGITDNINSLYFFDVETGFAAGNKGQLIKTNDGGSNWMDAQVNSSLNFQHIYFKNSNDGYLLSQEGNLLTSSNGGGAWKEETLGDGGLNSIAFNGNNAVIAGDDGRVFTSVDGTSWTPQTSLGVFRINDVMFFDESTVLAAGASGKLYKSTDKGNNWTNINSGTSETLSSITKMDSATALIVGESGTILEYQPNDDQLTQVALGLSSEWLKGVSCTNLNVCHAVGNKGTILIRNIGEWTAKNLTDQGNLNVVKFVNNNVGYIAGIGGVLYRHNQTGFPNSSATPDRHDILVYPTPAKDHLTVEHPVILNASIHLYNCLGELVRFCEADGHKSVLELTNLPPSMYFLHFAGSDGYIKVMKFIKK